MNIGKNRSQVSGSNHDDVQFTFLLEIYHSYAPPAYNTCKSRMLSPFMADNLDRRHLPSASGICSRPDVVLKKYDLGCIIIEYAVKPSIATARA